MSKLIASNQLTLTNLLERAIDRTEVTFWHGLSATKHPLGVYDCGSRDHTFGNEFNVTSGKTYTVRVIAKRTKGSIGLRGGIWYTAMTSGNAWDGIALFSLVGEASEDGLGVYELKLVVPSGKTKAKIYIQIEQSANTGFTTTWHIYDGQVFDENGQPLVTDQNNLGALTSPMAAPYGTYIWKRTITYYTDGTNNTVWEYSGVGDKGATGPQGPKGDKGIQGPQGADGRTQYTHIAYADDATGGGFSQTDQTKAYIGMYQDFNATDSTDPTKYRWTKWKGSDGAQGVPGPKGADGKTPYIHFAYADDNKGTNFSLTDNNQQYQGYYSDYTQADSTDYTKYKWVDRLANVQVGGVNLYALSQNNSIGTNHISEFNQNISTGEISFKVAGKDPFFGSVTNKGEAFSSFRGVKIPVKAGQSISVKLTNDLFIKNYVSYFGSNDIAVKGFKNYQANNFVIPASELDGVSYVAFRFGIKENTQPIGSAHSTKIKVEYGNVYTDWSPAPEDTQEQIDSKADQTLMQEQLNALEAKRLQMEVELKAKATLEQVSELETFINNLKQEDTDGRQKIIEITKAIEERIKDIEPIMEYSQKLQFMDTYITQGNGGMVIGANDSTTKVVVTPDRISFQSGGSEVAYISQRMLHIDNGVFTMSLQLGHYITRAHPKNEYVNATYFVK